MSCWNQEKELFSLLILLGRPNLVRLQEMLITWPALGFTKENIMETVKLLSRLVDFVNLTGVLITLAFLLSLSLFVRKRFLITRSSAFDRVFSQPLHVFNAVVHLFLVFHSI